jgi:hypothetical protein
VVSFDGATSVRPLRIAVSERIPLWRRQSHDILLGDLPVAGPGRFERRDLAPLLSGAGLRIPESSQREGIDTDATGRVFVLREVPGTVLVFDQALEASCTSSP